MVGFFLDFAHLADEVHLLLSQTLKCGFAGFPFGTDFRVQHFSMNTSLRQLFS